MNHSATAFKRESSSRNFWGTFPPVFRRKPLGKFVGDIVCRIQASQDVEARPDRCACSAKPISMKKLEDRLGRMLGSEGIEQGFRRCRPSGLASRPSGHASSTRPTSVSCIREDGISRPRRGTGHGGRSTGLQRLPGGRLRERRPPDHAVAHAAVVERGGGLLHQPERRGARRHRPELRAEALDHRPRWRPGLAVRRPGPAQAGPHPVRLVGNRNLLHGRRDPLAEELAASCP